MTASTTNLIWIDLEMTGLDTENDQIIEIATIVTDSELNILAEGPDLSIKTDADVLGAMDSWNTRTHTESGLVEKCLSSTLSCRAAELQTLEFLKQHVTSNASPMCGNSICQDRRFLHKHMPELEKFFHYRHLDVTTLKILGDRWYPGLSKQQNKITTHQALQDIRDSIDELKFWREHILK
jgi:oligoribonuclease